MKIHTSEIRSRLGELKAGDTVFLSGTVYTARDAAHAKICKMIADGEELPFKLDGATVYYAGPTPAHDGLPIGSCGPTTSSRMDKFTPTLIENGLCAMIGKGKRSEAVVESMKKHGVVYFCAVGGAGALAAKCVKSAEVIAFPELGCEAVRRLEIVDFPLIVGIDARGNCAIK
ncbi:MAG: fumarate hydratase C-terminal domain-containing protein [Clostridia bacterium]|nr:fumarate hydratase C-terminal domain-containing protein [Clostridia bacterium]